MTGRLLLFPHRTLEELREEERQLVAELEGIRGRIRAEEDVLGGPQEAGPGDAGLSPSPTPRPAPWPARITTGGEPK